MTRKAHTAEDVSVRILIALRDYAASKIGADASASILSEAIERAGGDAEHASDARAWTSLSVCHGVAEAYEERFGPTFVTDALTWAVPVRRDFSAMSLSAVGSLDLFYRHLDRARTFFARHVRFEVFPAASGVLRVQLHYRFDVPRLPASCRVARGILMAVPLLFDLPPATLDEHGCWVDGAPCCTYEVHYRAEPPMHWIGATFGAIVGVTGAMMHPTTTWLAAPLAGWLVGREIYSARVRRLMTRVSEEQRRTLADNDREFLRRYDQVRTLNETLEHRVAQRTSDMHVAMRELREQNASLRATLSDVKRLHQQLLDGNGTDADATQPSFDLALRDLEHELNNPLSSVLANLDHLENEAPAPGELGELADVVRDIRSGVQAIRNVLAWFIDIHRAPPSEPSSYALDTELGVVVEHFARRWEGRVTIALDVGDIAIAARGRQLTQVFANVIKNAGEAVVEGNVWVTAEARGGRAIVRVRDDGPGIAKDDVERIFERGFTTKADRGGSGLGLHISKRIVERNGGNIVVSSEAGEGTVFEIDLPLWSEPRTN